VTPGVLRELGIFTALVFLTGACFYIAWRLRSASRQSLASQRVIAHRAHLDTYTPQSQDRQWTDWAEHHGGGL
jgi:hypothetical protein